MANNAENEAARADYLKIAKDWLELATEIENAQANPPQPGAGQRPP